MSYSALFQGLLARLKRRRWGVSIKPAGDKPGDNKPAVDTGVQAFADEVVAALGSDAPIVLDKPIRIRRNYTGPVFLILDDTEAINYLSDNGIQSSIPNANRQVNVSESITVSESKSVVRT